MYKTITILATTLLFLFAVNLSETKAQNNEGGNFGVGVMAGSPTGVSAKIWMGRSNALHGGLAWSTYRFAGTNLHLHVDYTRYNYDFITANVGTLAGYYGIGGRLLSRGADRSDRVGVRVPFGLNYEFEDNPFEVFVEIAPLLDLTPSSNLHLDSVAGFRFFF